MTLIKNRLPLVLLSLLLLSACSPHPATGVWKATGDNELGINRLVVGYEGRAEFITTKLDSANWHCFWGAPDKKKLELNCTSSTNSDQKRSFTLSVNDQGLAEFQRKGGAVLATFTRVDENPSPRKK